MRSMCLSPAACSFLVTSSTLPAMLASPPLAADAVLMRTNALDSGAYGVRVMRGPSWNRLLRSGDRRALSFCRDGGSRRRAGDRGGELGEKIVRHLLGGAGDQPLAELGELAADLRLDIVGEQRAAILVGKLDHGAALGEPRDAALALAGDLVAVGRVE